VITATHEFDWFEYPTRRRRFRVPYRAKPTAFRMVLEYEVGYGYVVNRKLYKALKLPDGWRKNPRRDMHEANGMPVRFQCKDMSKALTCEQLETLQGQVALMLRDARGLVYV
jgi:hypothetical protein